MQDGFGAQKKGKYHFITYTLVQTRIFVTSRGNYTGCKMCLDNFNGKKINRKFLALVKHPHFQSRIKMKNSCG